MENKKILFIGNVLENTGYSLSDRYFIKDLSRFSLINIFHVPITFRQLNAPHEWMALLTKNVKNYDGYIVCCPISILFPHDKFSFFWLHDYLEFPPSTTDLVNGVKNIFVPSIKQKDILSSLSKRPVYNYCPVIYAPETIQKTHDYGNKLVFYTMAESITQTTLIKSISCYYWAFTSKDKVIFHINIPPNTKEHFIKILQECTKRSCFNTRNDLPEVSLDDFNYSDEQRWMLHKTCNVYVSLNQSESVPIAALEAAKIGNFVMYNNGISIYDEIFKPWLPQGCVGSLVEPGYDMTDYVDNNYAKYTTKYSPLLFDAIEIMKTLYNNGYNINPLEQIDNTKELVNAISS